MVHIVLHQISNKRTSVCSPLIGTLVLLNEIVEIFLFLFLPDLYENSVAEE